MHHLHGTCIPYSKLRASLPPRTHYIQSDRSKVLLDDMSHGRPIHFLPSYLYETSMQDEQYGKAKYKIVLMGTLLDGSRITVILDDITPYFEIQLKDGTPDEQTTQINTILDILEQDPETTPIRQGKHHAKQFRGYTENKSAFLKLYYLKDKTRAKAIRLIRTHGYKTASDDLSSYYRVVCRDYLTTFSTWAILDKYTVEPNKSIKGTVLRVSIEDFKPYTGELTDEMKKDKTLTCTWDIETRSEDDDVPQPENPLASMFCLGMTFQWAHDPEPFLQICLCDFPAQPRKECLTVVCGSERNIIVAFGKVFEAMRPEFIFGFNDSDYDWPWLIKRAMKYPGVLTDLAERMDATVPYIPYNDANVFKWNYKREETKLDATNNIVGHSLMVRGYIPADVRTIFRKLNVTDEQSSLKHFLEKIKLDGKEDMPYQRMFDIYRKYKEFMDLRKEAAQDIIAGKAVDFNTDDWLQSDVDEYLDLKKQMSEINYYCAVDARRCHEMVRKVFVITDRREISKLAYVSLYDSFYRADGMKVRNLAIAVGQQEPYRMRFTNIPNESVEEGKYPGAFVVPPLKGNKTSKLSIVERIQKAQLTKGSETPTQQEWLNTTEEEIQQMYKIVEEYGVLHDDQSIKVIEEAKGVKIDKKFREFLTDHTSRPIVGLDFSSLYPSIMRAFNMSPDKCIWDAKLAKKLDAAGKRLTKVDFDFNNIRRKAWFVWHDNIYSFKDPADPTKMNPQYNFGLFPYILNDLFIKRKGLKALMKPFEQRLEVMNKFTDAMKAAMTPEERADFEAEYSEKSFQFGYMDSKQKALKVYMNTFYGEAGNKRSPMYVIEVAGGITSYGQKSIKQAYAMVRSMGCRINYGDTDSIYLEIMQRVFEQIDKLYYSGKMSKLDYWTQMVQITFVEIKKIQQFVDATFEKDNGTKFLAMSYEEVLFGVAFFAKKKYVGLEHKALVNFENPDMFVRGLEVKKRGVSEILKKVVYEILWTIFDPKNLYDIMEVVLMKIKEIYTRKWEPTDFIQSIVYRPNKKNVKVHTFVRRMKERGIEIKPNERILCVIVETYPYLYDERGRKKKISMGDRLELVETYNKSPDMKIDLNHYMEGGIEGQLARLVSYHPMFHVEPIDNTKESMKLAEDQTFKNAQKFIAEQCDKYRSNYNTFGRSHQKIYKLANKATVTRIKHVDELAGDLLGANVDYDDFENWFVEFTEKKAKEMTKEYGKKYITKSLDEITEELIQKYTAYENETKTAESSKSASSKSASDAETDEEDDYVFLKRKKALTKVKVRDSKKLIRQKYKQEIKQAHHDAILNWQKCYYNSGNQSIIYEMETAYRETIARLRNQLRTNYDGIAKVYKKYNASVKTLGSLYKEKIGFDVEKLKKPTSEAKEYDINDFTDNIEQYQDIVDEQADLEVDAMMGDDGFRKSLRTLKDLYNNILAAHITIAQKRSIVDYLKLKRDRSIGTLQRPSEDSIRRAIKTDLDEERSAIHALNL